MMLSEYSLVCDRNQVSVFGFGTWSQSRKTSFVGSYYQIGLFTKDFLAFRAVLVRHLTSAEFAFFFMVSNPYLTTISTELGFLGKFVRLSLKTCSLYHEKLSIQKFKDISSRVHNNRFSASHIMEVVRGHFCLMVRMHPAY